MKKVSNAVLLDLDGNPLPMSENGKDVANVATVFKVMMAAHAGAKEPYKVFELAQKVNRAVDKPEMILEDAEAALATAIANESQIHADFVKGQVVNAFATAKDHSIQ